MSDTIISVENISKRYQVFDTPKARLLHTFFPKYHVNIQEIWALKNINFEIKRGEAVSIIGRNGSGKTTLLEIIAGTLTPTEGRVKIQGRVSALLELGSGFNPEYTGRNNVILNGLLLGLSKKEILNRFEEIEEFAEIGDSLDRPVKTYSSGMIMRLAFAVQVLCKPDILIIDEALSVGDFFFQQKCWDHIRGLCKKGMTFLFVSHDMGIVRDMCSQSIYLKQGVLEFEGKTIFAIQKYLAEEGKDKNTISLPPAFEETNLDTLNRPEKKINLNSILRDSIWTTTSDSIEKDKERLLSIAFYDENNQATTSFLMGSNLKIRVAYYPSIKNPTHIAVTIQNKYNQVVTSLSSSGLKLNPPEYQAGEIIVFEMILNLSLEAGNYTVMISINNLVKSNQGKCLDSSPFLGPISIQWDYEQNRAPFLGMFGLRATGRFIGEKDEE